MFNLCAQFEVDLLELSHTNHCQHYYTLESPLPLGALVINAFNHPWAYHACHVSPSALVPSFSSFSPGSTPVPSRTCQQSVQTYYPFGTLLDRGSLASQSSQYLGICSSWVSHNKGAHQLCLGQQVIKSLQLLHLTLWLLRDVCYTNKGSLPQSVMHNY